MKKIAEKYISVSDTLKVGIPFGKSYFERTPKVLRIVGDSFLTVSGMVSTLGLFIAFPPAIIGVSACVGILGKFISNCFSNK